MIIYKNKRFFLLLIFFLSFSLVDISYAANIYFTADAQLDLTGLPCAIYVASGSAADSLTTLGTNLTADIPSGSIFVIKTTSTVLSMTASGGTIILGFDTGYFGTGYVTQWSASSSVSGATVGIDILVPNANTSYLIKVDGTNFNYYTSNGSGVVSFTYNGGFSNKVFTIQEGYAPVSIVASAGTATAVPSKWPNISQSATGGQSASSTSLDNNGEMIKKLLEQIKILQLKLEELKGGLGKAGTALFVATLKMGSIGDQVRLLQEKLKTLGFFPKSQKITGFYGLVTKNSVIEFQKFFKIDPIGIVGPKTREMLNSL